MDNNQAWKWWGLVLLLLLAVLAAFGTVGDKLTAEMQMAVGAGGLAGIGLLCLAGWIISLRRPDA